MGSSALVPVVVGSVQALVETGVIEAKYIPLLDLLEGPNMDHEKAAIQIHSHLENRVRAAREEWILQAQLLYLIDNYKLWQKIPGTNYTSLENYCLTPELDIHGGVVSDMRAIVDLAPTLRDHGIDIWDQIRAYGISKIRTLVPTMRVAKTNNQIDAVVKPLVEQLPDTSYRELLDLVAGREPRAAWDPTARYIQNADGTVTIVLEKLSEDSAGEAQRRLKARRWFDKSGKRIDDPFA
jgi:hypothetical protein